MNIQSKFFSAAASLVMLFATPVHAVDAPMVSVSGNTLSWPAIDAITINVHRENGEWVESIPGNSTQWDALEEGGYFLVGADHGDWMGWGKSNVVQTSAVTVERPVGGGQPSELLIDNYYGIVYSQTSAELIWETPNPNVVTVEVFRNDGVTRFIDGTSLYESDLEPDTTYTYILLPYDALGRGGELVAINVTTANSAGPGLAVPATPRRNPAVSGSGALEVPSRSLPEALLSPIIYNVNRAEIFWKGTPSDELINYTVFRNGEEVGQTTGHSFYFNDLIAGTDYTFAVTNNATSGIPEGAATTSFTTGGLSPSVVTGRPAIDPGTFNFMGWDDIYVFYHELYPSDCIFALRFGAPDERFFLTEPLCFSPAQRDLIRASYARRSAGFIGPAWQFKLPGENSTNHIEALAWYNTTEFALVTDVTTSFTQSAYEISRFGQWGAFVGTVPILTSIANASVDSERLINLDGKDLQLTLVELSSEQAEVVGSDTFYGLRIVGEYYEPIEGGDWTRIDGWDNVGAFIALVNPIDGSTLEQGFLPGRRAQSVSDTE